MNHPHINKPKENLDDLVKGGYKTLYSAISVLLFAAGMGVSVIVAILLSKIQ